jgi:hypothetical protein
MSKVDRSNRQNAMEAQTIMLSDSRPEAHRILSSRLDDLFEGALSILEDSLRRHTAAHEHGDLRGELRAHLPEAGALMVRPVRSIFTHLERMSDGRVCDEGPVALGPFDRFIEEMHKREGRTGPVYVSISEIAAAAAGAAPQHATAALPAHEVHRIAYHEAGHIVVAWLAGFEVTRSSVGEPNEWGGFGETLVNWTGPSFPRVRAIQRLTRAQREALVYAAGRMGESVGLGLHPRGGAAFTEDWGASPGTDGQRALAALEAWLGFPDRARAELLRVRSLAESLLSADHQALRHVARRLESKGTLSTEQLAQLRGEFVGHAR